jgi:hypothetical protein
MRLVREMTARSAEPINFFSGLPATRRFSSFRRVTGIWSRAMRSGGGQVDIWRWAKGRRMGWRKKAKGRKRGRTRQNARMREGRNSPAELIAAGGSMA